jgi:predicted DNA-binding WGR domain protein
MATKKTVRRFEFSEGTSNKFWEIELHGSSYTVSFGRIGHKPQTSGRTFASPAEAMRAYEKIVDEKVGKGYQEVGRAEFVSGSVTVPKARVMSDVLVGDLPPRAAKPKARVMSDVLVGELPPRGASKPKRPKPLHPLEGDSTYVNGLGENVILSKNAPARFESTPASVVKSADRVAVRYTGTIDSVASVIWTMMQLGIPNPSKVAIVLDTVLCQAHVLRAYGESLAKALGFGFFRSEKDLLEKWSKPGRQPLKGLVIVLPGKSGPAIESRGMRGAYAGAVGVRPQLDWKPGKNLSLLDAASVRPPPLQTSTFAWHPTDDELKFAAKKIKPTNYEKALIVATVASGKFPPELVLYGEGEKREA